MSITLTVADRAPRIRRSVSRLCMMLDWAPLHEVPLGNGRRADILALGRDGSFVCIEVKSCVRDFMTDSKWPGYRAYSDALYFAVDIDFPEAILPPDVGVMVAAADTAVVLRDAPAHRMSPARRRALTQRFAILAATRLEATIDPAGAALTRTVLRVE